MPDGELEHFKSAEIQMLLGGRPIIDTEELKRGVKYNGGYDADSPQVKWLWEFMEHADQECLAKLVSFATVCSSIPFYGLNPPFTIVKAVESGNDDEAYDNMNRSLPR